MSTSKQKSAGRKAGARAKKCKGLPKGQFHTCLKTGKRPAGAKRRAKRRSR